MQVDEPAHLDRAAERDLAVALAEVQVAHRQVRPVDEDGVEDPGALGEVLDVLVAAVLPRRCGAGGLGGRVGERLTVEGARGSRPAAAGGSASGGTRFGSVAIRSPSRLFHLASSSLDGAVPIRPGWTMPVKETRGTWREVALPPVKSQITL